MTIEQTPTATLIAELQRRVTVNEAAAENASATVVAVENAAAVLWSALAHVASFIPDDNANGRKLYSQTQDLLLKNQAFSPQNMKNARGSKVSSAPIDPAIVASVTGG